MNQGSFSRFDTTFEIQAPATSTAMYTLMVHLPGGGVTTGDFQATDGQPMQIPNIFPEIGTYMIEIFDENGDAVLDGSGCAMTVSILFTNC